MYKNWCLQPKTVNTFFRETGWNKSASTSYPRCCPVAQPGHATGRVAPLPTVFSLWEITGCFVSKMWALTCLVAARQVVCQWKIRVRSLVGLALCGVLGRSCAWASAACASQHALTERTWSWQCDCVPWSAAPWFISCVRRLCGPVLIIIFTCCMESSCCLWFKAWTSLISHWIVHWVLLIFIQNLLWLVNFLPCSFKSKYHFP